jgi:diamine N-acetyltransferase
MISIKEGTLDDVATIHQLAHKIWPVAYKKILQQDQLDYMLDMMYSHEALTYQIEQQKHTFFLIYRESTPVGFASIQPKYKISNAIFRLNKLYILPELQGKGYGKKLLGHILCYIKPLEAYILELNVNRNNQAVNFYQRNGFIIVREEDIAIGKGFFMNDYVMQREV